MSTTTTTGGSADPTVNPTDGQPRLLTNAPLCQARNREGKSCCCPAAKGKRVCRMHGGLSPGAPKGQRNGRWKHGGDTLEAVDLRRSARRLLRSVDGG